MLLLFEKDNTERASAHAKCGVPVPSSGERESIYFAEIYAFSHFVINICQVKAFQVFDVVNSYYREQTI